MGLKTISNSKDVQYGIWYINESLESLLELTAHLDYDYTVIDEYLSEERKKQWLAVRLLTDRLVPNAVITYTDKGKPIIPNHGISISHSHKFIAVSINSKGDTGIDLQVLDKKIEKIRHKFLNDIEDEFVGDSLILNTIMWSVKEAMFKLYKNGSPYFKEDYNVEVNSLHHIVGTMMYNGNMVQKPLRITVNDTYVLALVNDDNYKT